MHINTWVVVKIMVLFWVPKIIGAYYIRDPKRDHHFDNQRTKAVARTRSESKLKVARDAHGPPTPREPTLVNPKPLNP